MSSPKVLKLTSFPKKISFQTGICLISFPVFFGSIILFPSTIFSLGISSRIQILTGLFLIFGSIRESVKDTQHASSIAALIITLIYLVSDVTIRQDSFLGEYFPSVYFISLTLLLIVFGEKIRHSVANKIGILAIAAGVVPLFLSLRSKLIFSDDHPCFLYRLTQLKYNFPNIPFYNPEWNGGVEAREFFASGILNVYLIFLPLIHFFEVEEIYNYIVIAILFLLLPISLIWTGLNLKLSRNIISILIALGISHSIWWYRWALSYGTLGFIVSMVLVPLNLSFIALLLDRNIKIKPSQIAAMTVSISLMLFWSLSGVLFVTVAIASLFMLRSSINKQSVLIVLVLLLTINLPWINIFYQASNVSSFVAGSIDSSGTTFESTKFKTDSIKATPDPMPSRVLNSIRKHFLPINPLVLFFGLAGLFYLEKNRFKNLILSFCVGAIGFGIIGSNLKPHLELDRMIVALSFVLTLPASIFVSQILKQKGKSIVSSAILALILLIPFWVYKVSSNTSLEKYKIETSTVQNLASVIREHNSGGRTLFSGFSLHELDGGHLAPLPLWTKSSLIASSYQHDNWRYSDVIPLAYREKKLEGVLRYFDLMNVSLVVTNDKFWRKWYKARPLDFDLLEKVGQFNIFKVKSYKNNFFLEGSGEVLEEQGSKIRLKITSDIAVVKFNYLPFLRSNTCSISPHQVGADISFIKVSNCSPNTEVIIEASGALDRFFRKIL